MYSRIMKISPDTLAVLSQAGDLQARALMRLNTCEQVHVVNNNLVIPTQHRIRARVKS
jgi:hypothetical protein